jgi:hypothetical protein
MLDFKLERTTEHFGSLHTNLHTACSSSFAFPSCSKLHSPGVSGSLCFSFMRLQCTAQYPFSLVLFCMAIVIVFVLVRGRSYFSLVLGYYKRHLLGWLALDRTGLHSVEFFKRFGFNVLAGRSWFGFGLRATDTDVDSVM